MKLLALTVIFVAGLLVTSCSKNPAADNDRKLDGTAEKSDRRLAERGSSSEEDSMEAPEDADKDEKPDSGDIGEDCVAFLSATKTVAAGQTNGLCPTCPANKESTDVLKFNNIKIDRVTLIGASCQVVVRIFATFNPSRGGAITGGLVGWIAPEQRAEYARGKTPPGQQVYEVNITYRRNQNGWQPIDFSATR
jgi:hypothetical protein